MKKLWNRYSFSIILIGLSCILAFMFSVDFNSAANDHYQKITVSEGDSLWKISQEYANEHSLSNKEFVNWVKLHNKLEDEQIYPGEEIVIPVNYKSSSSTELASAAGE
ncbi:cell division suppressor protein YneA [Bacillus sp. MUM 116]|uniref:cell division suppressor protein YneA n=1 Tax=Bacillus sp. MUM 116 TaxID=1678002 RepID=UPI0008F57D95|nr:LysM peptidoglycan-binding domain-containing protein [Bacillus sp. MUM 116]OIK11008.1 cell division suppressor protein YneA [Bacillus sp. MUM 116]